MFACLKCGHKSVHNPCPKCGDDVNTQNQDGGAVSSAGRAVRQGDDGERRDVWRQCLYGNIELCQNRKSGMWEIQINGEKFGVSLASYSKASIIRWWLEDIKSEPPDA